MLNIKAFLSNLKYVELFYLSLATSNLMLSMVNYILYNLPIHIIRKSVKYNVDSFMRYYCEFTL